MIKEKINVDQLIIYLMAERAVAEDPSEKLTDGPGAYILMLPVSRYIYIGSSFNLRNRKTNHLSRLRNGKSRNKNLQRVYDADGVLDFIFLPIPTSDREKAHELEQRLLDSYHGNPRLLNIAIDAKVSPRGVKHTEETRAKLKLAMNQRIHNTNFGQQSSERTLKRYKILENRLKQSEKIKAAWKNPETRKRLLEANKNRIKFRKVCIEGVEYPTAINAASILNIPVSRVHHRLKSHSYPDWIYLDEISN